MTVTPDQYETYEAMILSDQITAEEIEALLRDNTEFATWLRERARDRATRC